MRILFLLLVLANIGYFVWQSQQPSETASQPRLAKTVGPNVPSLTLLSELPNGPTKLPPEPAEAPPDAPPANTP